MGPPRVSPPSRALIFGFLLVLPALSAADEKKRVMVDGYGAHGAAPSELRQDYKDHEQRAKELKAALSRRDKCAEDDEAACKAFMQKDPLERFPLPPETIDAQAAELGDAIESAETNMAKISKALGDAGLPLDGPAAPAQERREDTRAGRTEEQRRGASGGQDREQAGAGRTEEGEPRNAAGSPGKSEPAKPAPDPEAAKRLGAKRGPDEQGMTGRLGKAQDAFGPPPSGEADDLAAPRPDGTLGGGFAGSARGGAAGTGRGFMGGAAEGAGAAARTGGAAGFAPSSGPRALSEADLAALRGLDASEPEALTRNPFFFDPARGGIPRAEFNALRQDYVGLPQLRQTDFQDISLRNGNNFQYDVPCDRASGECNKHADKSYKKDDDVSPKSLASIRASIKDYLAKSRKEGLLAAAASPGRPASRRFGAGSILARLRGFLPGSDGAGAEGAEAHSGGPAAGEGTGGDYVSAQVVGGGTAGAARGPSLRATDGARRKAGSAADRSAPTRSSPVRLGLWAAGAVLALAALWLLLGKKDRVVGAEDPR